MRTKLEHMKVSITVMILSFRTDMPGQTVQTQISLIRVRSVCHSVCIVWTHYSMVEPHSSNFRVITTNFLGVRIFRKFTVNNNGCLLSSVYCNPGQQKTDAGCEPCARGYYKDNVPDVFSMCMLCPIDKITATIQSTSIADCTVGKFCIGIENVSIWW